MPLTRIFNEPPLLDLFGALGEGMFTAEVSGRLVSVNDWGAHALGFASPAELLRSEQGPSLFCRTIDWDALNQPSAGFPFRAKVSVTVSEGSLRTFDVALVRDAAQDGHFFFGVFREVSTAENELRLLAERNKELEALGRLAIDATRFEDQGSLLSSMLEQCIQVVGALGGGIYLYDQARKRLVLSAHKGMSPALVAAMQELKLGQGFTGKVAVTRIPIFLDDVSNHPMQEVAAVKQERLRNFASFPLQVNDRLLGVISLHTGPAETFSGNDFALLAVLSAQVSLSLDHVQRMEELRERNEELERFNRLSVDRELRMIELKKRIRELEADAKLRR